MKTVLITGASSGIGKAIYDGYNKLPGYNPIGISKGGPDAHVDFKNMYWDSQVALPQSVDILINCAGYMKLNENVYDILELWEVNFVAMYKLIHRYMKPHLIVINIASVSGMVSDPDTPIYGATKAAVISLTSSLAKKHADIGARINCISPGFYDTNLVPEPTPQYLLDTIPLGKKEGRPKEMFDVVRFIERAEYMTGANIVMDGGLTCKI